MSKTRILAQHIEDGRTNAAAMLADLQPTQAPDLSDMTNDDLCSLMLVAGFSNDPSDKAFSKACRDELAKRKP